MGAGNKEVPTGRDGNPPLDAPSPNPVVHPGLRQATGAPPPDRLVELDGLRGFAMLLVLGFHLNHMAPGDGILSDFVCGAARLGFVGIDIFFALSGLLITGILLRTREAGGYFRTFYARRSLRIFPLYFVACGLFLHAVYLVPGDGDYNYFWLRDREISPLWYWCYLTNVKIVMDGDFHHMLMAVSWSLSIEEQFYLVWPAVVRWLSPRALVRLCAGLIVGALVLRFWLVFNGTSGKVVHVLTLVRVDALAAGSLLAVAVRDGTTWRILRRAARIVLPVAVVGTVAISCVHWTGDAHSKSTEFLYNDYVQSFGSVLVLMASTSLLVRLIGPPATSRMARFFRNRWLCRVGCYSYCIYLTHVPIIIAVREVAFVRWFPGPLPLLPQLAYYVVGTAASVAVAAASWRWVERPILRIKDRFKYWPSP
ncbi:MAG: hypothetical protein CMJ83_05340 [Planctomycetes bacterium]|nr:hypothetical protein [Planctomycetota bacterium]